MASWKKVLVAGQDLTDTTDLAGNTGALGIGTNGGITLDGSVADVTGVLLGTSTVNLQLNISTLGAADIAQSTDLLAFHDAGTDITKKSTVATFTNMLAGTAATTGLRNINETVEVNTAAAAAITTPAGTEKILVWDGSAHKSLTVAQIAAEASDGDITSVVAGTGLTGGATSGDATLNVIGGTGIVANANDVAIDPAVAGVGMVFSSGQFNIGEGSLIDVDTNDISVNLTEAAAATIAAGDNVIFLDGGSTGAASKGSVNDIATLFAGTGLTATDGVIAVDDVALGSGTTGNYVAAVTGGDNIAVSGSAGEGASFAVALDTNVDVAGTLDVTGLATFDDDLVVAGDLTVNGDVTTLNTANLLVEDTFIALNKAGTLNVDAGIVFTGAANKVFGWDQSQESGRFGVDYAGGDASLAGGGFAPDAWVSVTHSNSAAPTDVSNGDIDALRQIGNIYVNSNNEDIYIYS